MKCQLMKMSETYNKLIILLIVFCICATLIYFNERYWLKPEVIKTDTIEKIEFKWNDTVIKDTVFQSKYVKVLKRDTVYTKDSTEIVLERTQNTYEKRYTTEKDTADLTLYVSGIETALDSLDLRLKTHTEVKTVEVTKYIDRKKTFLDHFNVGLQAGYGYGFTSKQLQPYIGVGVTVNW